MNLTLRIFIIAVSAFVFISVIYMLVKRNLNESNSILWLFIASITLLFGISPDIVSSAAALVGIDYPPTLLFLVSIIVLLLIAFKSSMEISIAEAKLNETAITLSIMREENRRLTALLEEIRRNDPGAGGRDGI